MKNLMLKIFIGLTATIVSLNAHANTKDITCYFWVDDQGNSFNNEDDMVYTAARPQL